MREKLIAWSIEWEGCISLSKAKRSRGHAFQYVPVIMLCNTRKKLVDAFQQLVGYGKVYNHRMYVGSNRKDLFKWQIVNLAQTKQLCEEILPHLITKKRNAELLLEFCNIRMNPDIRKGVVMSKGQNTWSVRIDKIYQELRILNKRGIL